MVVAQAAVLLGTDAALILLSLALYHPQPSVGLQTPMGQRSKMHVFVELLICSALCVALLAVQILWSIPAFFQHSLRTLQDQKGQAVMGRSCSAGDIIADSTRSATTAAEQRNLHPACRSQQKLQISQGFASCLSEEDHPLQKQHRKGFLQRTSPQLMSTEALLLSTLVVGVVALAIQPAAWVLRVAFASSQRLWLLAYWAGSLALALPCMDWVSRSSGLSTIIVRKVCIFCLMQTAWQSTQ